MTIKMPKKKRVSTKHEVTANESSDEEETKFSIVKQERIKIETKHKDIERENDSNEDDEEINNDSEEESKDEEVVNEENEPEQLNENKELEDSDNDDTEKDTEEEEEKDSEEDTEEEEADKDSDDIEADDCEDAYKNLAWADSIAKILKTNKPKKKKTLVLSKAKKLSDPKKVQPKPAGFEVTTEDGKIAPAEIISEELEKDESEGPPRKKKKDIISVRVKPNILEKDRERLLSKIATKGVVQLFNAVKNQQREIETKLDKAGPLEIKRDKVLKSIDKRSFLDHLMGDKSKSVVVSKELPEVAKNDNDKATWNVLRDDFMMGSNKMKDWDKQMDEDEVENEMEIEQEMESD